MKWVLRALRLELRPGPEEVRLRHQRDLLHRGARPGRHLLDELLRRPAVDRRAQDQQDREGPLARPTEDATSTATRSARPVSRTSTTTSSPPSPRASTPRSTRPSRRCRPVRSTRSSSTRRPASTWRLADRQLEEEARRDPGRDSSRASVSTTDCSSRRATRSSACVNAAIAALTSQRHPRRRCKTSGSGSTPACPSSSHRIRVARHRRIFVETLPIYSALDVVDSSSGGAASPRARSRRSCSWAPSSSSCSCPRRRRSFATTSSIFTTCASPGTVTPPRGSAPSVEPLHQHLDVPRRRSPRAHLRAHARVGAHQPDARAVPVSHARHGLHRRLAWRPIAPRRLPGRRRSRR